MSIIYLAAGCFWGAQRYFDCLSGVTSTEVGYANGLTAAPTYEQVKHENTGHAETVRIEYDPDLITLAELLQQYFKVIDPVSVNRQGGDVGTQYRTGIYYTDPADLKTIEAELSALAERYAEPIAVEVKPLDSFYTAEEYHQKYLDKNPTGYCHVSPKMFEEAKKFRHKSDGKES